MSLYNDYLVTFRDKRALVSACVQGNVVSIASVQVEGDVDKRGQQIVQTFHDRQEGGVALDGLSELERSCLVEQVRRVVRG